MPAKVVNTLDSLTRRSAICIQLAEHCNYASVVSTLGIGCTCCNTFSLKDDTDLDCPRVLGHHYHCCTSGSWYFDKWVYPKLCMHFNSHCIFDHSVFRRAFDANGWLFAIFIEVQKCPPPSTAIRECGHVKLLVQYVTPSIKAYGSSSHIVCESFWGPLQALKLCYIKSKSYRFLCIFWQLRM